MYIKSLEKMEEVVKNNKSLSWDGWTVVSSYASEKGRTSNLGVYKNGAWNIQKRFEPNNLGWDIPDKFVG